MAEDLTITSCTFEGFFQQLIANHVGRGEQDEDFEVRKAPRDGRSEKIERGDEVRKKTDVGVENGGVWVGTGAHLLEWKWAL